MYSVIGTDGQTYGPVELETLKYWCLEGRVTSETRIVDPIDGITKRAADLPEVNQHLRPPVTPTAVRTPSYTNFEIPNYNYSLPTSPYPHPTFYATPAKSKLVAILLAFFLGALGVHRFYLGHIGTGLAMLLITVLSLGSLAFITGIWAIVDIVLISTGAIPDAQRRPLTWP